MSDLFADSADAPEAPVTARRSIGTTERAIQVTTPNYDYHYLCPELRRKRMIPILTNIRAKTVEEFGDLVRHSGEEFIYVLKGRIEVHTEFYEPEVLGEGESIYLDSQMGHAYIVTDGCDEALVLGICSSPDEGLMNSLMSLHGPEAEGVVAQIPPSRPRELRPQTTAARPRMRRSGTK
jgi:mannose-6-phosphate isomerase-like protein (cupin superfamily)